MNEPMDPRAPYFGTYEEEKERMELEIKLTQVVVKGKKRIAKLKQASSILLLTDNVEDDNEESKFEEEESIRNKGKVIITKPTKSSTIVFTRRAPKSRKKLKLGEEDVEQIIFKKPPPTLQEKLKELEGGDIMENFKSFRYETRNADEKK